MFGKPTLATGCTVMRLGQLGLNPTSPNQKHVIPVQLNTVRNGHARTFSSELIHILLLKIQKVRNIS
jgi:hypothetical protein